MTRGTGAQTGSGARPRDDRVAREFSASHGRGAGPDRTAVVFPGQGTQRPGMGRPWRRTPSWNLVREIGDWTGVDAEALLLTADADELRRTDRAQLAVFALEVVIHAEAARAGLLGAVVGYAGHSLGEFAALYAAGVVGLRECALLVAERGAAMLEAAAVTPGAMTALVGEGVTGGGGERLASACRAAGHAVWVANLNSPQQVVLSGTVAGVEAAERTAAQLGLRCVRLDVGGAFHSPLMLAAEKRLRAALAETDFADPVVPPVSGVDGRAHPDGSTWRELMARQLTEVVHWAECVRTLAGSLGASRVLELGPGRTLSELVARIDPDLPASTVRTPEQLPETRHGALKIDTLPLST